MDQSSFLVDLSNCVFLIDAGRKGFATNGKEHEGRIFYEKGISGALAAFQEAGAVADPQIIILAESAFLQQELQFCGETDIDTKSSLTQAIESFNDTLRCLKTVENAVGYRYAETTYPNDHKHRIKGLPRDALHSACISHRTRIKNILRVPGMNPIERAVYEQRFFNMTAAQNSYIELQKKALTNSN